MWAFSLSGHSRRRNWSKLEPSPIWGATCTRRWWKSTHQHQQPRNTNRKEWQNGATYSGGTQPAPHPLWASGLRASWYEREMFSSSISLPRMMSNCAKWLLPLVICRWRMELSNGILEKFTPWLRSQRRYSTSPGVNWTLWSVTVTQNCSSGKYNPESDDNWRNFHLNLKLN